NGSELVLFDLNRTSKFGPLLRDASQTMVANLLPPTPRRFRTTVITNAGTGGDEVERTIEAGADTERTRPLGLSYPSQVLSLSHVAVPFPATDALYGFPPDPAGEFRLTP